MVLKRCTISPAELDELIELHRSIDTRDSRSGQPKENFKRYAKEWARVREAKGGSGETFEENQKIAFGAKEFIFNYRSDLSAKHRIVCQGKSYDILRYTEVGFRKWSKVIARARTE